MSVSADIYLTVKGNVNVGLHRAMKSWFWWSTGYIHSPFLCWDHCHWQRDVPLKTWQLNRERTYEGTRWLTNTFEFERGNWRNTHIKHAHSSHRRHTLFLPFVSKEHLTELACFFPPSPNSTWRVGMLFEDVLMIKMKRYFLFVYPNQMLNWFWWTSTHDAWSLQPIN